MNKQSERQARYDARTARRYSLKLHKENDKDIIRKLDSVDSIQGYIKHLIRADVGSDPEITQQYFAKKKTKNE